MGLLQTLSRTSGKHLALVMVSTFWNAAFANFLRNTITGNIRRYFAKLTRSLLAWPVLHLYELVPLHWALKNVTFGLKRKLNICKIIPAKLFPSIRSETLFGNFRQSAIMAVDIL
jgi:hypothetical protein